MPMRKGLADLETTEAAWEQHAAADRFYDTTLAQYKTVVQTVRQAQDEVDNLKRLLESARNRRDDELKRAITLESNVAKGIAGDSRYGEDSDLYEGTGRVRKSERKTGLTRKKKKEDPE